MNDLSKLENSEVSDAIKDRKNKNPKILKALQDDGKDVKSIIKGIKNNSKFPPVKIIKYNGEFKGE